MFIMLRKGLSLEQIESFQQQLARHAYYCKRVVSQDSCCLVLDQQESPVMSLDDCLDSNYVDAVYPFDGRCFLTSKQFHSQTCMTIKGTQFGSHLFPIIAGPCAVESQEQIHAIAAIVKQAGAHGLRGGAFKPRTRPYDFQGLGLQGLKYLRQAADEHQLFVVSEMMDLRDLDFFLEQVDVIQIGARNMQNYALLKALGCVNKPILLKRGLSARYEELLASAEYLMSQGNTQIILCERGIRSFETYTRNVLDVAAAPILKELSHLPVIIDPSHGLGLRKFVPPLAYAAMAVGADGLMVEMHTHPEQSISDAKQTISPAEFFKMIEQLRNMAPLFQRTV